MKKLKEFIIKNKFHIIFIVLMPLCTILFSWISLIITIPIYIIFLYFTKRIKVKTDDDKTRLWFFGILYVVAILWWPIQFYTNNLSSSFGLTGYKDAKYINVNVYNSDTTNTLYKDSLISNIRISCDSIQTNKRLYYNKYKKFTRYSVNIEGLVFAGILNKVNDSIKQPDSIISENIYVEYQPFEVDDFKCGDTLKLVVNKPYWDRDLSLLKITKIFINSNWLRESSTEYKNQSPKIYDYELNNIFNNTRAEYRYDKYIKKYTLQMMDETKIDTLEYESDAISLLEAKCKDKSMIDNKLKYSEFEACKNNNSIQTIKILTRPICGYSKVDLDYERGTVSSPPDNCFNKPNYGWTYE